MKTYPFGLALLTSATLAAAAWAQSQAFDAAGALRESRLYMLQARTGDAAAAAKGVVVLETAVAAAPDSAPLWAALGNAHMTTASLAMGPGGDPAKATTGFQKAPAAYATALRLDPNDVDALSGHGLMSTVRARQKPEMADQGMAEMTRAVQLAPTRTAQRLSRAFAAVNLPPAKRDVTTIVEDLTFLARVAGATRSGDYVRLMLGDLYYESGNPDLARTQYAAAARPGAKAEAEARARLDGLASRTIPAAEIQKIRAATGTNCAMCHGG